MILVASNSVPASCKGLAVKSTSHLTNQLRTCLHQLCLPCSVEVGVQSQLYQDNGYTYKPAIECVQWLKAYFSPLSSGGNLVMPGICPGVYKEGGQCPVYCGSRMFKVSFCFIYWPVGLVHQKVYLSVLQCYKYACNLVLLWFIDTLNALKFYLPEFISK